MQNNRLPVGGPLNLIVYLGHQHTVVHDIDKYSIINWTHSYCRSMLNLTGANLWIIYRKARNFRGLQNFVVFAVAI